MKVFLGYQDILEVIKNGVTPFVEGATDAQRSRHKEEKMKCYKALFLLN